METSYTNHYKPENNNRMSRRRLGAAGAYTPENGWLISGGNEGSNDVSVDQTFDGETFGQVTPSPLALARHCLVPLDNGNGDVFLTGGWTLRQGQPGADMNGLTYIFNGETKVWDGKSTMPTARAG